MTFRLFKHSLQLLSDEELMAKILKNSNEKAFEVLYERYHQKLIWFSKRLVGDEQQAEDIVHDTFIKIIDHVETFDTRYKFSTWVYAIVKNASLSAIRKESNRQALLLENYQAPNNAQVVINIDNKLLQSRIQQLYDSLTEKEQLLFILRFELTLSLNEIADIAQIPLGSVKSCLFYLLKKLSTLKTNIIH